jgi:alpha 1,2-mannosyltransferase
MANRSNARLIRFGVFALVLILCGYILSRGSSYSIPNHVQPTEGKATANVDQAKVPAEAKAGAGTSGPIGHSAVPGEKIKATFVSLARNSDLNSLMKSIRQVEDRFNRNYHYDWTFLNDEEFTEEFKQATSNLVSGKAIYGLIPKEHWSFPEWIDLKKAADAREKMQKDKVIYGGSISYRHMCRFESGFFWRHPVLDEYEYYWRVEPDIEIFCDVDYDVFKWMKDNNKDYSFTITLPEYKATIPTLWDETKKFIKDNSQYLAENNLMEWISNDNGETYNGCHFWSNFEIANLNFWRSDAYKAYFEHLDKAGGFFYERWGDAPIHSIAAALFLPRDRIHFFGDIGYFHNPFHNCPFDKETRLKKNCVCDVSKDFTWKDYSCTEEFHTIQGLKKPVGWEAFAG